MAAGEGVDERGAVVAVTLHRDGGELQPGDPAFSARLQRGDGVGAQVQPHCLVQEGGGFVDGEAQVGGAHFGQLAARSQPRQRQRRVFARGDHQVQGRRQMLNEKCQRLPDRGRLDDVVVVQHQQRRRRERRQLVDQRGQQRFQRRRLWRTQRGQHARAQLRRNPLHRRREIDEKARRIVVANVEREPGDRTPTLRNPGADQRRLAKTRRRGDQRQPAVQPGVQPRQQTRAVDGVGARRWDVELGGQQRRSHGVAGASPRPR